MRAYLRQAPNSLLKRCFNLVLPQAPTCSNYTDHNGSPTRRILYAGWRCYLPRKFLIIILHPDTNASKVGNRLFKIHKRVLMRSEASTFATMFSLPRSSQTEGQTDENPIVLEGDTLEDFEGLMRILYPP